MGFSLISLVFLIAWQFILPVSGEKMIAPEYNLIKNITSNYSSAARPIRNPSEPVTVNFTLWISGLYELNMKKKMLVTHGFVLLTWMDEFLTWRPEDFWNQTSVVLKPDSVWVPPVSLDDGGVDTRRRLDGSNIVHVQYDGKMYTDFGWPFPSICDLDGTYMPFDQHVCYLTFAAYQYRSDLLQLYPNEDNNHRKFSSGEFALIDNRMRVRNVTYAGYNYSRVEVRILLKRLPMSTVVTTLLPSAFLSFLAGLMYQVPVDSGDRLTYGVSILLSFGVFLLLLANQQPPTTDSVPVIMMLILSVMALIVVTLGVSILQSLLYQKKKMPTLMKYLPIWKGLTRAKSGTTVIGHARHFQNENRHSRITMNPSNKGSEVNDSDLQRRNAEQEEWQQFARRLDRVCQTLYYVFWVTMYVSFFIFVPVLGGIERDTYSFLYT